MEKENITIEEMLNNNIKTLIEMEDENYEYYNGDMFMLSVYLFLRYGEIPSEINENLEYNYDKLSEILGQYDSLFNIELNEEVEDFLLDLRD